eukprot:2839686-Prorocentrum_lima.AAC.1
MDNISGRYGGVFKPQLDNDIKFVRGTPVQNKPKPQNDEGRIYMDKFTGTLGSEVQEFMDWS